MAASVDSGSPFYSLSSLPEPSPRRGLLEYVRTEPLGCLHSFLSFHHYAVVSYTLILTHFFLLHLCTFFLMFDYMFGTAIAPRPYLVLLAFLAGRSTLLLALFAVRLRFPALWYPSSACPHSRRFVYVLTVTRLLSIAALVFGSLHWLLLTPPAPHGSVLVSSPAVPCLLLRECVALLMPVMAMSYLRIKGRRRAQLSAFIPYSLPAALLTDTAAAEQPLGKRRGLTASECEQLGEQRYSGETQAGAGREHEDADVCAICLSEFSAGMRVRRLHCSHTFHVGCVDVWLQRRGTCPLCVQHCAPTVESCLVAAELLNGDNNEAAHVGLHGLDT